MTYYAPMQLYAILAFGVACHSIVTSRLASVRPSSGRGGVFAGVDSILFVAWVPLMMYQLGVVIEVFPESLPYHPVKGNLGRVLKLFAYFFHTITVFLVLFWIPYFYVKLSE